MHTFQRLCIQAGLPCPQPEYKFRPDRKWRIDWAFIWEPLDVPKLALEVQGGLWVPGGGRHQRGAALLKEYEKLNALACDGWHLFFVTRKQFDEGSVVAMVCRFAESRGLMVIT